MAGGSLSVAPFEIRRSEVKRSDERASGAASRRGDRSAAVHALMMPRLKSRRCMRVAPVNLSCRCYVLGHAIAERPVFLADFHEVDEDILSPHLHGFMQ